MLKARVISGLSIGVALLAATLVLPTAGALAVLLALTVLGLHEIFTLLDAAGIPNFRVLGTAAGGMLVAVAWAAATRGAAGPDGDLFALALCVGVVFARQLFARSVSRPLETMAGTLLGILYIAFALSFIVRILMAWGPMTGRWPLFYMIGVVKSADIGAYFVGCRFGRHKLIPHISPAKTWEGFLGGLLTAVAVSLAVRFAAGGRIGPMALGTADAVMLGALLTVTGLLGDLSESVLKRAAGVKDSSRMIAGMGGLLDVIDSLLPSAPLFYFYVRWVLFF